VLVGVGVGVEVPHITQAAAGVAVVLDGPPDLVNCLEFDPSLTQNVSKSKAGISAIVNVVAVQKLPVLLATEYAKYGVLTLPPLQAFAPLVLLIYKLCGPGVGVGVGVGVGQ